MRFEYQYSNVAERQSLIDQHSDEYLIEERNVSEGNFLVFTDVKPTELLLAELQQSAQTTSLKLNALDEKSEIIEGAVVELATMVLE